MNKTHREKIRTNENKDRRRGGGDRSLKRGEGVQTHKRKDKTKEEERAREINKKTQSTTGRQLPNTMGASRFIDLDLEVESTVNTTLLLLFCGLSEEKHHPPSSVSVKLLVSVLRFLEKRIRFSFA